MAEFTGKNLVVSFKSTALESDYRSFSNSEQIGIVDASAGSDVARTYLTTLEDGSASVSLVMQTGGTAATAMWNLLDKGAEGTLDWYPEGTASGNPRSYVNAIVIDRSRDFPYDDLVTMSAEFQFSGVVTDGTAA